MNKQTSQMAPSFKFRAFEQGNPELTLLDQAAERIPAVALGKAAKSAAEWLLWVAEQSAEKQEEVVKSMSVGMVHGADSRDEKAMAAAMVAASVLSVGRGTASDMVQASVDLLAERYQTDW